MCLTMKYYGLKWDGKYQTKTKLYQLLFRSNTEPKNANVSKKPS